MNTLSIVDIDEVPAGGRKSASARAQHERINAYFLAQTRAPFLSSDVHRSNEDLIRSLSLQSAIVSRRVRKAMREADRKAFVHSSLSSMAYYDRPLPVEGEATRIPSTISQPWIVAVMTELADVHSGHIVAEVGTGSGYQSAIFSQLVGKKGRVVSFEIDDAVARTARERLHAWGAENVEVIAGDALPEMRKREMLVDRLLVTALLESEELVRKFSRFITQDGLMVAPVRRTIADAREERQLLTVYQKIEDGKNTWLVRLGQPYAVSFVPFRTNA